MRQFLTIGLWVLFCAVTHAQQTKTDPLQPERGDAQSWIGTMGWPQATQACENRSAEQASARPSAKSVETRFNEYRVATYENEEGDHQTLEIRRAGALLHSMEGFRFAIGHVADSELAKRTPVGSDITARGVPMLVVSEWTGGAHCCYRFHLFEVGTQFRFLQTMDAGHGDQSRFENLDQDPALEFQMNDWTFAYWRTSFAQSPAPRVILKFSEGQYRLCPDLMRKVRPTETALRQKAAELASSDAWNAGGQPPVELWVEMLDLIYAGNPRDAWELLRMSWPANNANRADFEHEFRAQLARSPFAGSLLP